MPDRDWPRRLEAVPSGRRRWRRDRPRANWGCIAFVVVIVVTWAAVIWLLMDEIP